MTANEASTRIPLLEREQVTPELASVYDALLAQRGVVPNMFKTVAHVPSLALAFAALLKAHGVAQLVDVRSIPKSRHCPQFNFDVMPEWIAAMPNVRGVHRTSMKPAVCIRSVRAEGPGKWATDSGR